MSTNIFILGERLTNGEDKLLGIFDSEAKLLEYLRDKTSLSVVNGKVELKLDKTYVLVNMPINMTLSIKPPVAPAAPVADRFITMRSDSDYYKSYKVGVRGSTVISCDCPDFTYRGHACKHMARVARVNHYIVQPSPVAARV